jgi:hypothetical protein
LSIRHKKLRRSAQASEDRSTNYLGQLNKAELFSLNLSDEILEHRCGESSERCIENLPNEPTAILVRRIFKGTRLPRCAGFVAIEASMV